MRRKHKVIYWLEVDGKWWVPSVNKFLSSKEITRNNIKSSYSSHRRMYRAKKTFDYADHLSDSGEKVLISKMFWKRGKRFSKEWWDIGYYNNN